MAKKHGVLTRTIHWSYLSLPESWRAGLSRDLRGQVRDWLGLKGPTTRDPRRAVTRGGAAGASGGASALTKVQAEILDPTALEERLWSGFAAPAQAELEALAGVPGHPLSRGVSKGRRSEAAWALARWHAAQHANRYAPRGHADPSALDRALTCLARLRELDAEKARGMRVVLLESDCLRRRGEGEAARRILTAALARRRDDPDLRLAMANTYLAPSLSTPGPFTPGLLTPVPSASDLPEPVPSEADAIRLDWINQVYRAAGIAELTLRDPARGLRIDNLAAEAAGEAAWEVTGGTTGGTGAAPMPRVSVIMPVYKAAATLPFALESLLAQTWPNLEILVVDDASPDDTAALAEGYAARDARIKVIRQPENRGGYAARNAGWLAATGDFITTHDADDWSHPQKIALQMRHMRDNPEDPICFSDWVRATPELGFGWLYRAWSRFAGKSMSSILIPRPLMERLGGWDVARVGGDTDLLRRIQALAGDPDLSPRTLPGVPLAFALHAETSLTRVSATHVRTMLYGARREYAEAGEHWRRTRRDLANLRMDPLAGPDTPRPFPAPPAVLGRPDEIRDFDLLVVTDFAMKGGSFVSTLNTIKAAVAAGLRVGVFHWRRYDLDMSKPINPGIRDLAQSGQVAVVSAGETVRADTVVFGYPVILNHVPDPLPAISCDAVIVVVNQMAERMVDGSDPQYDPLVLRETLRRLFGPAGEAAVWAPISGLVARLMRADPRYPPPSEAIWIPLLDTRVWCAQAPRWRGAGGAMPVVGRHGRDEYTKWPSRARDLRAAYCADRPCAVEIMGGAGRARDVIGAFPANWTVHAFGTMDAHEFLDRLDVFVHYPHETYIEEFGRAVLEALARGLPAVLPPVFRETFGAAAVYAEPDEVWPTISALWADKAAYLAQAERGQTFVRAMSDWTQFPARLERTLNRPLVPRGAAPDGAAPATAWKG